MVRGGAVVIGDRGLAEFTQDLHVVDGDAAVFGSKAEEVKVEGDNGARGQGADVNLDGAGWAVNEVGWRRVLRMAMSRAVGSLRTPGVRVVFIRL